MNFKLKSKRVAALMLCKITVLTLVLPAAAAEVRYMPDVTKEMTDAMPTEFDTDINTNIKGISAATPLTYETMLMAMIKALAEVKVVMNGKEMGAFVTDTIERVVYA